MKIAIESVLLGMVSLPGVVAWGSIDLGHDTAAYIASYFVSNSTAAYLKDLLDNQDEDYLAGIAMFADKYKFTHEGHFTENFHFIDAHDDPYTDCNVNYDRDCKKGAVLSALNRDLSKEENQLAVKLLVHYIGDLHQPLHNEDVKRGGNDIHVQWRDRDQKLHAVWDKTIPETIAGHLSKKRKDGILEWALEWANELTTEISNGKFARERNTWLKNFDISDPLNTAMDWSIEANKLVCSHVFPKPNSPEKIEGKELSGRYYAKAAPVVEKQIARAGYRMAAWLNEIAHNNWEKDNEEL
ncbi:hypothetical protein TrVFT333_002333 [Trichoderma virens FT-333]|nr:hypothetical protein TrVFT333_002333 [Trichoderma virens FT-333]